MATGDDKSAAGSVAESPRSRLRAIVFYLVIVLVNVAVLEVFLRVADFAVLRVTMDFRVPYDHDPELGWAPVPNENSERGRTNSLGLADIELAANDKPAMMFLGDSLVHGIGVMPTERFTDRLREELSGFRILNAGIVGYGTDQEYLLLRRLWPKVDPKVVVLIVCVFNDHDDNSSNSRYGHTLKPYLANAGGEWVFRGQPVPVSARWYFYNSWLANHSAIVRSAIVAYTRLRHPPVTVPDPTEQLIGMMRDFVQSHGARFLVGLQLDDPKLEPFLQTQNIPYVRLAGAATLGNGIHWTPDGHKTVVERLKGLFATERVLDMARQ